MKGIDSGIYFNAETREVLRVTGSDPGEGWVRISGDQDLGLLDTRRQVRELGLDDDPAPHNSGRLARPAPMAHAGRAVCSRSGRLTSAWGKVPHKNGALPHMFRRPYASLPP